MELGAIKSGGHALLGSRLMPVRFELRLGQQQPSTIRGEVVRLEQKKQQVSLERRQHRSATDDPSHHGSVVGKSDRHSASSLAMSDA